MLPDVYFWICYEDDITMSTGTKLLEQLLAFASLNVKFTLDLLNR